MAEKSSGGGESVFASRNQKIDGDERDDEPAFVAGQRSRDAGEPRADHGGERLRFAKQNREVQQSHQRRQDHRFRHGSGLQVQKIGIESQQAERGEGNGGRMRRAAQGGIEEDTGTNEACRRRDCARQPAAPELVVSHERQHQQVRQRQPDGAHLIVARLSRIDDAARDVQMRLRVAIIQSPAGMIYVRSGRGAERGQRDRHQGEFQPDVLQNSVKSRNSWKRASMSLRVRVRKRSTPNFSQQKLPMTEP